MNKITHFLKYKLHYEIAIIFSFFMINNTILATSVIMEASRRGEQEFRLWEPFLWQYSSAIGIFILIPFILKLLEKYPPNWQKIKQTIFVYIIASIIFSLCHFFIMWAIRWLVYAGIGWQHNVGELPFELLYEYRKDIWTFFFIIFITKVYQFILSRLQGEANPILIGEDTPLTNNIERLLVKKLGKEFIIKIEDIEWLESAGNYVNLHSQGRIYPTRATLTNFIERLSDKGFCRIHRSHAVNLEFIDSITPLSSGDSEVKLLNGKTLNLSRRYKEEFKQQLG